VVKDSGGRPVPDAELAVVVVDEAILALSNYQLADPLSVFYTDRTADIWSIYGRASIVLTNPQGLAESRRAESATLSRKEAVMEGTSCSSNADDDRQRSRYGSIRRRTNPYSRAHGLQSAGDLCPCEYTDAEGTAEVRECPVTWRVTGSDAGCRGRWARLAWLRPTGRQVADGATFGAHVS
jgi:hypothetical protein